MAGSLPPMAPLLGVSAALAAAGVEHALGGSGLLHALGLADHVGDWDLTTDAPADVILRIFQEVEHERVGPSGVHADSKLRLSGGVVELILGMAFQSEDGICRIPTMPAGSWQSVPLASPEAWAVAYMLMGRPGKADLLFRYLERQGASPAAVARLAREPLPVELSDRLARLPARGAA